MRSHRAPSRPATRRAPRRPPLAARRRTTETGTETHRPSEPPRGERLQKLLSFAGTASRRAAEKLILAGRVAVNGRVVHELGTRADPARDVVTVDGERLVLHGPRRTIALHKPRGVVATLADPEGRPTIRQLLRGIPERLYPVGRLDLQTSGLVLCTNDGTLAAQLLSGAQGVERVYHVKVDGRPAPAALQRIRRGIRFGVGPPLSAEVTRLRELPTKTWLEVRVRRGQWHLVRRLCEAIGHPVDKLERVAFGPIELGRLPAGAWRDLAPYELAALRAAAGLAPSGTVPPSADRRRGPHVRPRARHLRLRRSRS